MSRNKRLKKKQQKNQNKAIPVIKTTKEDTVCAESPEGVKKETNTASEKTQEQEKPEKGRIVWKKVLGIAAGTAALVLVGVYIGGMVYYQKKFFPNTSINGIDASYRMPEEIEAIIKKQFDQYEILLKERDGDREKITAGQFDYHYVSKGEVEDFLNKQKTYTWPVCFWNKYTYTFDSSTEFNFAMLKKAVRELKCFTSGVERAPKEAYMEFQETSYEIVKEEEGKKVRKKKLQNILKQAIAAGNREVNLEKEDCYYRPAVRSDDRELNRLVDNLNAYAKTSITYRFGEALEVLDGSVIKDWLSFDEAGNVSLDEGQIPVYVAGLAEKYDTYNKPRHFKTNDGSYVDVQGGHYGWQIDREAESAELLELVKTGAQQERTAIFAQTAASRENSDLGRDYIEIDLTRQHLWMYVDGREIVSSEFVSGDLSRANRTTPPGTFTLYYKKSPSVLRSNTPGDSYETPVTYWMPFNGGIGLHDADWRGSFGGNIYKYNGSHGCINLPTSAAREIYRQIYTGFPIICFYR